MVTNSKANKQYFCTYPDISHKAKVGRQNFPASTCLSAVAKLTTFIGWNLGGSFLRDVTNFNMLI